MTDNSTPTLNDSIMAVPTMPPDPRHPQVDDKSLDVDMDTSLGDSTSPAPTVEKSGPTMVVTMPPNPAPHPQVDHKSPDVDMDTSLGDTTSPAPTVDEDGPTSVIGPKRRRDEGDDGEIERVSDLRLQLVVKVKALQATESKLDVVRDQLSDKTEALKEVETRISKLEEEHKQQLASLAKTCTFATSENTQLNLEADASKTEMLDLRQRLATMTTRQTASTDAMELAESNNKFLKNEVRLLKRQYGESSLKKQLEALTPELDNLRVEKGQLESKVQTLETHVKKLEETKEENETELQLREGLEKDLQVEKDLQTLQRQFKELEGQKESVDQLLKTSRERETEAIESHTKELEASGKLKQTFDEEKLTLQTKVKELERRTQELQSSASASDGVKTQLETLQREFEELQRQKDGLELRLKTDFDAERQTLQTKVKELERRTQELQSSASASDGLEKDLQTLQRQFKELEDQKESVDQLLRTSRERETEAIESHTKELEASGKLKQTFDEEKLTLQIKVKELERRTQELQSSASASDGVKTQLETLQREFEELKGQKDGLELRLTTDFDAERQIRTTELEKLRRLNESLQQEQRTTARTLEALRAYKAACVEKLDAAIENARTESRIETIENLQTEFRKQLEESTVKEVQVQIDALRAKLDQDLASEVQEQTSALRTEVESWMQCADKLKGKLREARRAAKEDLEETRLDYEGKMQELISQKDSEAEKITDALNAEIAALNESVRVSEVHAAPPVSTVPLLSRKKHDKMRSFVGSYSQHRRPTVTPTPQDAAPGVIPPLSRASGSATNRQSTAPPRTLPTAKRAAPSASSSTLPQTSSRGSHDTDDGGPIPFSKKNMAPARSRSLAPGDDADDDDDDDDADNEEDAAQSDVHIFMKATTAKQAATDATLNEMRAQLGTVVSLLTNGKQDTTPNGGKKLPGPRAPEENELNTAFRIHVQEIFGISKYDEIANVVRQNGLGADQEDIDEWLAGRSPDPTLDPICPDWSGGCPSGSWNKKLSELVAADFTRKNPHITVSLNALAAKFMKRLSNLKTKVWSVVPIEGETTEEANARVQAAMDEERLCHRQNRRRLTMWKTHRATSLIGKSMPGIDGRFYTELYSMLNDLGPEGQSSDESDVEDRRKPCVVRVKAWRSPAVNRAMEYLSAKRIIDTGSGPHRGRLPHERTREPHLQRVSKRDPIRQLPINYYDPIWIDTLPEFERRQLRVKEEAPLPNITEDDLLR